MTTTKAPTIENFDSNKRKFLSDDEVHPPSAEILSITNQVESNYNTKRMKNLVTEQLLSSSTVEIDDTDDMMIYENSNVTVSDNPKTDDTTSKSQVVLGQKHFNGISNVDTSTPIFFRCYCDPYRLNALMLQDLHIY